MKFRFYSTSVNLLRTPLYELHVKNGGKMVEYAKFAMPVLYNSQSHVDSHNWVRMKAGLFDVGHMVQHKFKGPDALKFLEKVTPSDLKQLKPFHSKLSVLLNENGKVVDDTIITKHSDTDFYVVTNAGCREKDLEFFTNHSKNLDVDHEVLGGGLIAIQGPQAASSLQKLTDFDLSQIYFGQAKFVDVNGVKVHISRGGYTGEDGFEISIPKDSDAVEIATKLLDDVNVQLIGLAARDTLRLEAGMCLYGHELSEEIGPVEARLSFVISKRRRSEGGFNGATSVLADLKNKPAKFRTGILSEGPAPRHGAKIFSGDELVGEITSGSMSPTLKKNVSMAYLPENLSHPGCVVDIEIRGKRRPATVCSLPFVESKYYRQKTE